MSRKRRSLESEIAIAESVAAGRALKAVAYDHGITHERARQILVAVDRWVAKLTEAIGCAPYSAAGGVRKFKEQAGAFRLAMAVLRERGAIPGGAQ